MAMAAYAARRTFFYVVVFFVVSFLVFFAIHALVGHDSFYRSGEGDLFATGRHYLVIEPPIVVQYFRWLGDFFTGHWGVSNLPGLLP